MLNTWWMILIFLLSSRSLLNGFQALKNQLCCSSAQFVQNNSSCAYLHQCQQFPTPTCRYFSTMGRHFCATSGARLVSTLSRICRNVKPRKPASIGHITSLRLVNTANVQTAKVVRWPLLTWISTRKMINRSTAFSRWSVTWTRWPLADVIWWEFCTKCAWSIRYLGYLAFIHLNWPPKANKLPKTVGTYIFG